MTRFSVGQPVTQVEAPRLLTGHGRYTDDVTLPRQSYAVFLRSPHAHADIRKLDTSAAAEMPGVLAILTGHDYAADELGEITGVSPLKRRNGARMFRPPRPAIRTDRVRHVGQIVAMVIAETINQAKDAAEAIAVEYEPLPFEVDPDRANKPGSVTLWPDCPDNESCFSEVGDPAAVDAALAKAPYVLREQFHIARISANAMEPRAVVAAYDPGRDHYTVYACQQRPFVWRTALTSEVFHIPEQQMTVIAGDVGGSFGMKGPLYAEVVLTTWAARRIGRPVKWTCERSEGHAADDQGRDMTIDVELGMERDGNLLAARLSSRNANGAYVTVLGWGPTRNMPATVLGLYRTPALHGRAYAVMTNTVPTSNYRAPSAPGACVLERAIDIAARDLGIDPVAIRRRNLIPANAMPYTSKAGSYDCGEFEIVMDKCLKLADYDNFAARQAESAKRGLVRGVGLSTTVDPSVGPGPETAELRFDPGGNMTLVIGSTAGGQSHATVFTQIISDRLGIDAERIRVIEGETDKSAWGSGTGAARTATTGGNAVNLGATKIIVKAQKIAAHLLEAAVSDLEFANGKFTVAGTDRSISFSDVAKAAFEPTKLGDVEAGLHENATWNHIDRNYPYSAHVCEVELDPETGVIKVVRHTEVHDAGVELNPLLVNGQIHGGVGQATGEVLMERVVYDENGQLLTGSFLDYAMPRASDTCFITTGSHPVPTKTNPLGVKGCGEVGMVGGLAALSNAVADALAQQGVRNFALPATPSRVWEAINAARRTPR